MSARTQIARQKAARKAPAAPSVAKKAPKPVEAPAESKNQQGKAIQAVMHGLTVEAIAAKTGYSTARVEEHVSYECSKGRSKMSGKKVQVIKQPAYRG